MSDEKTKNILVAEDDFMVAMDAEDCVCALGMTPVTVATVDDALSALGESRFAGAIVDFNLGNENSKPVVAKLAEREVPFAVVSGAQIRELRESLGDQFLLFRKPVDYQDVLVSIVS